MYKESTFNKIASYRGTDSAEELLDLEAAPQSKNKRTGPRHIEELVRQRTASLIAANEQLMKANEELARELEKQRQINRMLEAEGIDQPPREDETNRLFWVAEKNLRYIRQMFVIFFISMAITIISLVLIARRLESINSVRTEETHRVLQTATELKSEMAALREDVKNFQVSEVEHINLIKAMQEQQRQRMESAAAADEEQDEIEKINTPTIPDFSHWKRIY